MKEYNDTFKCTISASIDSLYVKLVTNNLTVSYHCHICHCRCKDNIWHKHARPFMLIRHVNYKFPSPIIKRRTEYKFSIFANVWYSYEIQERLPHKMFHSTCTDQIKKYINNQKKHKNILRCVLFTTFSPTCFDGRLQGDVLITRIQLWLKF
jgi:hypothetical protein